MLARSGETASTPPMPEGKWDNRPSWDNGPKWDSRPTWDNWNKTK
ncbi:multiple cyclophane-containing RiPP AmcA [Hamadaea sp. NPDC051192]